MKAPCPACALDGLSDGLAHPNTHNIGMNSGDHMEIALLALIWDSKAGLKSATTRQFAIIDPARVVQVPVCFARPISAA